MMTLRQVIEYAERVGLSLDSELYIQQVPPSEWKAGKTEKIQCPIDGDQVFHYCATVGGYKNKKKIYLFTKL